MASHIRIEFETNVTSPRTEPQSEISQADFRIELSKRIVHPCSISIHILQLVVSD